MAIGYFDLFQSTTYRSFVKKHKQHITLYMFKGFEQTILTFTLSSPTLSFSTFISLCIQIYIYISPQEYKIAFEICVGKW